ncbi:MAG: ACT domain-containing protein [Bacteroidota bacterium]
MNGETNLRQLIRTMKPRLNKGDYIFCTVASLDAIDQKKIICLFKEDEGYTVILEKELADQLKLNYSFVAAWITLTIHSSLEAVGLTAAFSDALAKENISCNVVAAFYHDHIFVNKKDAILAMRVLSELGFAG